ncbi:MAG: DegT/DnrJ/EryC1/StrS family aminotransferase, partial [Pseudomonadales bacterium]|nr:DegT/DnrJ/EryC1/StrS family aminotransferase [Pseudomonadales bacterium]
ADRSQFFRGLVDKYTWQTVGSSFLPGEIIAAFLWAQLEDAEDITARRLISWQRYHDLLEVAEVSGLLRRPVIPSGCQHNAHMYYVLLPETVDRQKVITRLAKNGVSAVFHYVPLHTPPAGLKYGRVSGSLNFTETLSRRILRLPLWVGISEQQQQLVVQSLIEIISSLE